MLSAKLHNRVFCISPRCSEPLAHLQEGGLMVNLGGYRTIDVMEITSKDAAAMQLGASSGIKTWGDEIY